MAIDRRSLLLGTIAAVVIEPRVSLAGPPEKVAEALFVAAAKRGDGRFVLVLMSADAKVIREIPLSARGHDIAFDERNGKAVVFARRPGTFAVAFDTRHASEPVIFTAKEGRHFYGHGAFSRDGRLLYVSENDVAGARGVIGIYDVGAGYVKIGEHSSYGVGPHEIVLMRDGRTLAVANGGLDTVPEAGRENLNRDTMEPSLVFVDSQTGTLRAKHTLAPELKQLSIRHIAADVNGLVWFGAQWQGAQSDMPALIGSAGQERVLRLLQPALSEPLDLKGYVGSMAVSADGCVIAASAPKAGRIAYVDATTGKLCGSSVLADACGIAGEVGGAFAATSGFGILRHEDRSGRITSQTQLADTAFDNHLRRLG